MLLIDCPWCGPRDQREFNYGGDGTMIRPPDPNAASDEAWYDYVYIRDNPRGSHIELWQHNAGCRRWFKLRRDVVTHAMQGSAPIGQELPPKP